MAVKFQYNKTSLQGLDKALKMREKSLPTIKSKEQALRMEVKKAKDEEKKLEAHLEAKTHELDSFINLWSEFDTSLVKVDDIKLSKKKIAGVNVPILDTVEFSVQPFSLFSSPVWFMEGAQLLKDLATVGIEIEVFSTKADLLEYARKKTTQKVNLFEKVQIPGYKEAIMKIKRFLEDEENLSKAAQKIVKDRHEKQNKSES
ncbi:MAG: V-type ATP synthase subunit D [Bacteroidales bacterium]